jgi:hypothetical protein
LDGPTYLKELSKLVAAANAYMETDLSARCSPSEPLRNALVAIRKLLALVGFSDATCRAGLALGTGSASPSSRVVGGERALLDELCRFRSAVRSLAVSGVREQTPSPGSGDNPLADILALCDDARERVFPALGVELLDDRIVSDASPPHGDASINEGRVRWKYCVPRKPAPPHPAISSAAQAVKSSAFVEPLSIPVESLFRMGQYEGRFREFEPSGMPTQLADGSPVSNRLRHKLQKKLERHARRLEEADQRKKPK